MKTNWFKKYRNFFYSSPLFALLLTAALVFAASLLVLAALSSIIPSFDVLRYALFCAILTVPAVLLGANTAFLFMRPKKGKEATAVKWVEYLTILPATWVYFIGPLGFGSSFFQADWYVQLYDEASHTPLATAHFPTIIAFVLVALAGYALLSFLPPKKQPPLVTVLGIAAVALGICLGVVWCVQLSAHSALMNYYMLYPVTYILLSLRLVRDTAFACAEIEKGREPGRFPFLHKLFSKAVSFPVFGLLLALPLLAFVACFLLIFGQQPDSAIKAWTETADWHFSQKIAPENLVSEPDMSGHYLCTVAARGHRKLVKPLRTGRRGGRTILVNRQLCVANAFEQLLEERTPRFHRAVRNFYNKAGLPVSRYIRRPWASSLVYLVMKPLEWLFLAVLYLFDLKPENRIALQYPHAPLPKELANH